MDRPVSGGKENRLPEDPHTWPGSETTENITIVSAFGKAAYLAPPSDHFAFLFKNKIKIKRRPRSADTKLYLHGTPRVI